MKKAILSLVIVVGLNANMCGDFTDRNIQEIDKLIDMYRSANKKDMSERIDILLQNSLISYQIDDILTYCEPQGTDKESILKIKSIYVNNINDIKKSIIKGR